MAILLVAAVLARVHQATEVRSFVPLNIMARHAKHVGADRQVAPRSRTLRHFALLSDHQVALSNVKGVGYQIVRPPEQTAWAEDQGDAELKKALRKRRDRLVNVNMTSLTQDERRQNADALARLGALAGMAQRTFERKSALNIAPPETE
jgi:hypothetical protein